MRRRLTLWLAALPALLQTTLAESPAPSGEAAFTGSLDLGYRWRTDVAGSVDTYRTLVNLGSGPKLLGAEFTVAGGKGKPVDRVNVRASSWGDEPYATLHVDAAKARSYDLRADYRDIAYFNFLPSFADPLLSRGVLLNERSLDMRRRFAGVALDLLPGNWFVPYLAFDRDSGSGTGVTTFVSDANEYAVPNTLRDSTNLYRGGVRFERRRLHATIEEGGTVFKDDQSLFNTTANSGNLVTPVLGRTLSLDTLLASYGIRGASAYSKVLFTASATSWLDLYGQFRYSRPDSNVNYRQTAAGNLYLQSQALFYSGQQYIVSSAARVPHTSGSLGAEIRPHSRVRILESWLTDRMDNNGSAAQRLTTSDPSRAIANLLSSTLTSNYSQQEINLIAEATAKLTLRGGYRYVWGDAAHVILPIAGLASSDRGTLRRHVGLGGLTYRASKKISFSSDAEAGSSDGVYFRTSLHDYQKVRAQVRYQALGSLIVSADFNALNNQDPTPGARYDYFSHMESLALTWSPNGGKYGSLQGAYTHSGIRSDIGFLAPQDLASRLARYREMGHTASALLSINLSRSPRFASKLTAGGSFFQSSGSRPTSYFQPSAKLSVPVGKHANGFAEWRYYGYGEAFYLYEGFRAHAFTTGLRFTR